MNKTRVKYKNSDKDKKINRQFIPTKTHLHTQCHLKHKLKKWTVIEEAKRVIHER